MLSLTGPKSALGAGPREKTSAGGRRCGIGEISTCARADASVSRQNDTLTTNRDGDTTLQCASRRLNLSEGLRNHQLPVASELSGRSLHQQSLQDIPVMAAGCQMSAVA